MRKIVALEKQRRIQAFGKGISRAIAKVKPRCGVDALAIAPKRLDGEGSQIGMMRYNLGLDKREKIFKIMYAFDAMLSESNLSRFLIVYGADKAAIVFCNHLVQREPFRLMIKNGNDRIRIDDDHRGRP